MAAPTLQVGTGLHKEIGQDMSLGLVALHLLAIAIDVLGKKAPRVRAMLAGNKALPAALTSARDDTASR